MKEILKVRTKKTKHINKIKKKKICKRLITSKGIKFKYVK